MIGPISGGTAIGRQEQWRSQELSSLDEAIVKLKKAIAEGESSDYWPIRE